MSRSATAVLPALLCSAPPAGATIAGPGALTASTEAGRAPLMLSPFGQTAAPAPEALPADETVRARSGRYATRQEAEELGRQLGGGVVWVDVDCCVDAAIDRARGHVAGPMAALDLADDAPVFVTGAEPALAARAADALSDQGLTRAFLVTR